MTRTRASSRDAGTKMERDTAQYLTACLGVDVERRQRTGKDRGDLSGVKTIGQQRVVCELKSVTRTSLPTWTREAEVERANDGAIVGLVIHKRVGTQKPAEQWVTMTLGELVVLLTGNRDHYADP